MKIFNRGRPKPAPGVLEQPGNVPSISDGLDYSLPILLSGTHREALEASGGLQEWLKENSAATFRFQFDTPMRTADDLPFMPPTEDPLREWSASTRRYVLESSHSAYARNPIANRACKYVSTFVVGEGFNLACKNLEVQDILNDFIESPDNDIRSYERQAPIDLMVDGELMLRLYRGTDDALGTLAAVPQRPWECQWIKTERGFFRRRLEYRFLRAVSEGDDPTRPAQTETEDVPADDILHVAINRHGYELRGRPELYAVLPWLRAYKEWLENRARQNFWRSAFLWMVRVKSASANTIASVAARWRRPPSPGSVAIESESVEVTPLANPVGAADVSEDGRQIKLMSAVGFGLPEYMLADGAYANLASSTSQQLPALLTFSDYQRTLVEELWSPLFKLVLQEAIAAGKLPEVVEECDADGDPIYDDGTAVGLPTLAGTPVTPSGSGGVRMIPTLEAFTVTYSPISDGNMEALAKALEIAAANGWVDGETATNELGFDYGIVQKRLKRQQAERAQQAANGEDPNAYPEPPGPPGEAPPKPDA